MLELREIIHKYQELLVSPAKMVTGMAAALPALAKARGWTVILLSESEASSETFSQERDRLFKSLRVAAVLSIDEKTYALISPVAEKCEEIWYLGSSSTALKVEIKDGYASVSTEDTPLPELLAKMTEDNVSTFCIPSSEIDAKFRIDFRYYDPKNVAVEAKLSGCPPLEDLALSRGGLHTNFRRTPEASLEGELIEYLRASGAKLKHHEALFLGLENISPVGSIMGTPFPQKLKTRPRTKPAIRGEIIISLAGPKGNKGSAGDTLGQAAIIEESGEFYVPQTFGIVTPLPGVDPYFLLHQLSCKDVKDQLERLKKPVNKYQMLVTKSDFKKVRIPDMSDEAKEVIARKQRHWIASFKRLVKEREESCKGVAE